MLIFRLPYSPQKLARCHNLYAETLSAGRAPDIVRDNGVRMARYREFEQEFSAWVGQGRPEPEVDRGLAAKETESADDHSVRVDNDVIYPKNRG